MKVIVFRAAFETSNNYQQILVNNLNVILYIFLLLGIDMRLKRNFEIRNSTSKVQWLFGKVAHILFCLYRVVILLIFSTVTLCCLDWICNIINNCSFKKCIRYVSFCNAVFCSTLTYVYIIYKRDSISKLLQHVIKSVDSKIHAFPDVNIRNRLHRKIRIAFIAFLFNVISTYLMCIVLSYRYFWYFQITTPSFQCDLYSGVAITWGCQNYENILLATIIFCVSLFLPFLFVAIMSFHFIMFLIKCHFDMLTSRHTNINGSHKVKYVADIIKEHKQCCTFLTDVNCNFEFLIFVWFAMLMFQAICALHISTDHSIQDRLSPTILLITLFGQFLIMCFMASSLNSKVSYRYLVSFKKLIHPAILLNIQIRCSEVLLKFQWFYEGMTKM